MKKRFYLLVDGRRSVNKFFQKGDPIFPYESIRDFTAALEVDGKLLKINEMDQDRFEITAFSYKLDERLKSQSLAFIVKRTKIDNLSLK